MSLQCQAHRLIPRAAIERFQEWVYHTDHPIAALVTENYFLPVRDRLIAGDVIEAYAAGLTCVQHLRLLVAGSARSAVTVTPFAPPKEPAAIAAQEAPMLPRKSESGSALELRHMRYDIYRIVDGRGDTVVGDIRGHAFGVDLYGRIRTGKLSVAGARREAETARLAAVESRHHDVAGAVR